jgi:hypothetical protein
MRRTARATAELSESIRENAALQVATKLALDERGHRTALLEAAQKERLEMLLHHAVEHGLLGMTTTRELGGRACRRRGLLTGRHVAEEEEERRKARAPRRCDLSGLRGARG